MAQAEMQTDWRVWVLVPIVLAAVIFTGYSNTGNSPFVFDDNFTIVGDDYVENFAFAASDWRALFGPRGLRDFSLGINYYYGGLDPVPYHAVNTALHIIASVIVFILVNLLSRLSLPSQQWHTPVAEFSNHDVHGFFVALLFAIHPIQTMSVTNITQRSGQFLAVFYLLAVIAFIKARLSTRPVGWWLLLFVSTALALISRETSATLPATLLLIEWLFLSGTKDYWRKRWGYIALLGLLAVTVPARYLGLMPMLQFGLFDLSAWGARLTSIDLSQLLVRTELIDPWQFVLTEPRVIMRYIGLLFWPVSQNADWDISLSTTLWQPITTLLSFISIGVLLAVAVWFKDRAKLAAFGILFFFVALSIEASVVILPDVMFEYRLYLPLIGWALVLLEVVRRIKQPVVLVLIIGLLTSLLTTITFQRNTVWSSMVSFWQDVVDKSPNVRRAHKNLSVGLLQEGRLEEALYHAERVVEIEPDHASGYRNLGVMLTQVGRLAEAKEALQTALEIEPDHPGAYNNLGNTYAYEQRWAEALVVFKQSLALEETAAIHQNVATAYANLGRYQEAITHYEKALDLDPMRDNAAEQLESARRLMQ